MKVMPGIDISNGIAVKRVRGVRGSGITIGNPLDVAYKLYKAGYDSIHIVDLDAAEGVGNNESVVRELCKIGFQFVQVGGGIRSVDKAIRILSYGASAVVISSIFFIDRVTFDSIVRAVGEDKVIVALDYDSSYAVMIKGWREKAASLSEALKELSMYNLKGTLFTYVGGEGMESGVDEGIAKYVRTVRGLKGYAGGISTVNDLIKLKSMGFDYAIVGMALYRGRLWGVKSV
jgi:phosphoribosylformimino-5-aminoimidazole carboxamide ribotide isomerase